MDINIKGKNIDVNPTLKSYAEKKLCKVEKYLNKSHLVCQVTFSTLRDNHVVEVTIPLNGYLLRAEETSRDAFNAVDRVLDKLEKQIERYRTRTLRRSRNKAEPTKEEQDVPTIVKVKRFAMKPMLPEEAIMQLELLGHDFYMFSNDETGNINVLYRRKDGNYGLIEPEE
jgi:putative sigma-54 modulation protein